MECEPCPKGTWSSEVGAVSSEVCTACPVGTWGSAAGASSAETCIDCPKGTWSDKTGLASYEDCAKCPAGTWGDKVGAASAEVCHACPIGSFNPAVGQANKSVCRDCAPGTYNTLPRAAACRKCPRGTFVTGYESTVCTVCPAGSWTSRPGAQTLRACRSCPGGDCLRGMESVRLAVGISGLNISTLEPRKQVDLRNNMVRALVSFLEVPEKSVVDKYGRTGSITLGSGMGGVSAYLLEVSSSALHDLTTRFYSRRFRDHLLSAIALAVGTSSGMIVTPEVAEPARFEAEAAPPATSAQPVRTEEEAEEEEDDYSTTSSSTTAAPAETEGTEAPAGQEASQPSLRDGGAGAVGAGASGNGSSVAAAAHSDDGHEYLDLNSSTRRDGAGGGASSGGPLAWPWFVTGGVLAGIAVTCCIVTSLRRSQAQAKRLREEEDRQHRQARALRQQQARASERIVISV